MHPSMSTSKKVLGELPNAREMTSMKRTSSWHRRKTALMVNEPMTKAVIWFIMAPKQRCAVSAMVFPGSTWSVVAKTGNRRPTQYWGTTPESCSASTDMIKRAHRMLASGMVPATCMRANKMPPTISTRHTYSRPLSV